jgi:hypothetical protein
VSEESFDFRRFHVLLNGVVVASVSVVVESKSTSLIALFLVMAVSDTALHPLNESFKFFLANIPFSAQPNDIREHFSVSKFSFRGDFRFSFSSFRFQAYVVGSSFSAIWYRELRKISP